MLGVLDFLFNWQFPERIGRRRGTRHCEVAEDLLERRDLFKRNFQREQIAGVSGTGAKAANRSFEVADFLELHTELCQRRTAFDPRLDHFLALLDRIQISERLRKPVAEAARAHRRDGAIERAVKRGVARRIAMERFEDFKIPQRCRVERQEIGGLIKRNAREV